MNRKIQTQSKIPTYGFTIVELLIVIVVIGILAALVIGAYSKAQQQARNTARINAAVAWVKAIDSYTIQTGRVLTGLPACLGSNYTDVTGDGIGDCGNVLATDTSRRSVNPATDAALIGAGVRVFEVPLFPVKGAAGQEYVGVLYTAGSGGDGVNGIHQPYVVQFWLEGNNQDCGSTKSLKDDPAGGGLGTLTRYTYGSRHATDATSTQCRLTLQYVANL